MKKLSNRKSVSTENEKPPGRRGKLFTGLVGATLAGFAGSMLPVSDIQAQIDAPGDLPTLLWGGEWSPASGTGGNNNKRWPENGIVWHDLGSVHSITENEGWDSWNNQSPANALFDTAIYETLNENPFISMNPNTSHRAVRTHLEFFGGGNVINLGNWTINHVHRPVDTEAGETAPRGQSSMEPSPAYTFFFETRAPVTMNFASGAVISGTAINPTEVPATWQEAEVTAADFRTFIFAGSGGSSFTVNYEGEDILNFPIEFRDVDSSRTMDLVIGQGAIDLSYSGNVIGSDGNGSLTVASGASLHIGGMLTVGGHSFFEDNSTLVFDIGNINSFLFNIDGDLTIGDEVTLMITDDGGIFDPSESYSLVNLGGELTGGFTNIFLPEGGSAVWQDGEMLLIPEPSTYALIGGVLALIFVSMRRRR